MVLRRSTTRWTWPSALRRAARSTVTLMPTRSLELTGVETMRAAGADGEEAAGEFLGRGGGGTIARRRHRARKAGHSPATERPPRIALYS